MTGAIIGISSSLALPAGTTAIISKPPATTIIAKLLTAALSTPTALPTIIIITKLLTIALPLALPATTIVIAITKLLTIALPTPTALPGIATVALRRGIIAIATQRFAKGIHERLALRIAAPTGLLLHHVHHIHHTLRGIILIRLHNRRYQHCQNR